MFIIFHLGEQITKKIEKETTKVTVWLSAILRKDLLGRSSLAYVWFSSAENGVGNWEVLEKGCLRFFMYLGVFLWGRSRGQGQEHPYHCPFLPGSTCQLAKFASLVTVLLPVHLGTWELVGVSGWFLWSPARTSCVLAYGPPAAAELFPFHGWGSMRWACRVLDLMVTALWMAAGFTSLAWVSLERTEMDFIFLPVTLNRAFFPPQQLRG